MSGAARSRLLERPLAVASVGAELFADELERQGIPVERVDWRPPAGDLEGALATLALHSERIAAANDEALTRLQEARPLLLGIATARDAIAGLDERTLLHAGPPIEWDGDVGSAARGDRRRRRSTRASPPRRRRPSAWRRPGSSSSRPATSTARSARWRES